VILRDNIVNGNDDMFDLIKSVSIKNIREGQKH